MVTGRTREASVGREVRTLRPFAKEDCQIAPHVGACGQHMTSTGLMIVDRDPNYHRQHVHCTFVQCYFCNIFVSKLHRSSCAITTTQHFCSLTGRLFILKVVSTIICPVRTIVWESDHDRTDTGTSCYSACVFLTETKVCQG